MYTGITLVKANIIFDTFLGPKPELVKLPSEPICEEMTIYSSEQSEREYNARNA